MENCSLLKRKRLTFIEKFYAVKQKIMKNLQQNTNEDSLIEYSNINRSNERNNESKNLLSNISSKAIKKLKEKENTNNKENNEEDDNSSIDYELLEKKVKNKNIDDIIEIKIFNHKYFSSSLEDLFTLTYCCLAFKWITSDKVRQTFI